MKKLSSLSVLPEVGEVMSHQELYGKPFHVGGRNFKNFGGDAKRHQNPIAVCMEVITPDHTETDLLVTAFSHMANMFAGPRELIVAEHPYAEVGDLGVVAVMTYGPGKENWHLGFFVSGDGKDPRTERTRSRKNLETGLWEVVSDDRVRMYHLRPVTKYYITMRRINGDISLKNPPLGFATKASGDESVGSEIPIDMALVQTPSLEGAKSMTFDGVEGMFIPNI